MILLINILMIDFILDQPIKQSFHHIDLTVIGVEIKFLILIYF